MVAIVAVDYLERDRGNVIDCRAQQTVACSASKPSHPTPKLDHRGGTMHAIAFVEAIMRIFIPERDDLVQHVA